MRGERIAAGVLASIGIVGVFAIQADAARFTSSSYIIDASVANGFGGQDSSSNYKLVGSGGEGVVGTAASGSYRMGMGYTAQLMTSIQVNALQSSVSFPTLVPGSPQTVSLGVTVQTDASGYSLAISQDRNLTDAASNTIPKISGTIASPVAWVDGTTKGLGFTVTSATAGVPSKWTTGPAYAAMPDAASPVVFYSRSGQMSGSDTVSLTYKLDTATNQAQGAYSNTATITGTMTP